MRLGLQIPSFTWPDGQGKIGERLATIAKVADDAGFASLWVMDHLFQIEMVGPPTDPMLECYTTLGYLAGLTQRIRLGAMVTAVAYRHPGILIKTVTTLDVLSGGRAYLGIGAAWFEREARGLGVPFPPLKTRFEQLEETLQIAKHMWSDTSAPYEGRHFHLAEPITQPQPFTQPHPPILIGGGGEHKTLRLVAQYADACNLFVRIGTDALRHKLAVLRQHCEEVGRPYEEIEKSVLGVVYLTPGAQTPDELITLCRALADEGIQHFIFSMPNVHEITPLEVIGREVIPIVASF